MNSPLSLVVAGVAAVVVAGVSTLYNSVWFDAVSVVKVVPTSTKTPKELIEECSRFDADELVLAWLSAPKELLEKRAELRRQLKELDE